MALGRTLSKQWPLRMDLTLVCSGLLGGRCLNSPSRFCHRSWLTTERVQRFIRALGGVHVVPHRWHSAGLDSQELCLTRPLPRRFRMRWSCCFRCRRNPERKLWTRSARLSYAASWCLRCRCTRLRMCSDQPESNLVSL